MLAALICFSVLEVLQYPSYAVIEQGKLASTFTFKRKTSGSSENHKTIQIFICSV